MNQQKKQNLAEQLTQRFGEMLQTIVVGPEMPTIEVAANQLLSICKILRDEDPFYFDQLTDVCGVDYRDYGTSQWRTYEATNSGFSRAVNPNASPTEEDIKWDKPRYAAVYHLLSVAKNQRLRIRVLLEPEPLVPSVMDIWFSANWFEREAFDLYGIVFEGHPDLRRILTDYGFKGHPFRKDFPLIGEVEMRYDATLQRCVYEPVSIQPRVLVPKVIREDNRYRGL